MFDLNDSYKKKRILIFLIIGVILIIFVAIYILVISPAMKYDNAVDFFEQGEYHDSAAIFKSLGNYKDSNTRYNESLYSIADRVLSRGSYDVALEQFSALKDYKDSATKVLEVKYLMAEDELNKKNYDAAIKGFTDLKDYKDSAQRSEQISICNIRGNTTYLLDGNKITISVETNLIDGSIVSIGLLNLDRFKKMLSVDSVITEYLTVKDGKVQKTFDIPEQWGSCYFEVSSDFSMNYVENPQPQNVIDVYGIDGEYLIGDNVEFDDKNQKYISFSLDKKIAYPNEFSASNANEYRKMLQNNNIPEDLIPFYELDEVVKVSDDGESLVVVITSNASFDETFEYYKNYLSNRGAYRQQPFDTNVDLLFAPIYEIKKSISIIVTHGVTVNGETIDEPAVAIMLQGGEFYELSKTI